MKTVTIYTDGACSGNPGPGGWGAILQYGEFRKELSGGEPHTTNNRMELTGVITALEALKEPYRPVCRLCLLEERSPEEAALALGRPVKTIHTQLSRGRKLLRERLERSGIHGNLPR